MLYKRTKSPRLPDAVAVLNGAGANSAVHGVVRFFQRNNGVLVEVTFEGLPRKAGQCDQPIFGFHIHGGTSCTGNTSDMFADAGTHYNPYMCEHPYHAGDLPPIFGVNGKAYMSFLTDRFTVRDVLGKTIILHDKPDDFTTQPSGNAGNKIACGIIGPVRR